MLYTGGVLHARFPVSSPSSLQIPAFVTIPGTGSGADSGTGSGAGRPPGRSGRWPLRAVRRACALAGILAVGLVVACSDPGPLPMDQPQVEIGTGTVAFEPLMEDQPLILYAGPQGGFHFVVHARIRGMLPGDPTSAGQEGNPVTWFRVFDQDGVQVDIPESRTLGYEDTGDGWHVLPSGRIVRVVNARVPALYGARVLLQVLVEDASGRTAQDEIWITAVDAETE